MTDNAFPGRKPARPGVVLAVTSSAVILTGVDLFVVQVALPPIGAALRVTSLPDLSWLLNAYTVMFAALLVPLGRLADRGSRKAGFLAGVGIFTAASACCASADSLPLLIAFRALQGAGAALLTPASLGLLLHACPPDRRAGAVRAWTAMSGMAAVIGPVTGGALVQWASWRWVFLVNVPVGVAALVAGARLLPRPRGEGGPLPDLAGTVLLAGSVGAVVLALVQGNTWHWDSARVIGLFAGSAAALALALARSARHPVPVFEPAMLRVPGIAAALASTFVFCTAFGAGVFALVLLGENTWGWSPLRSGAAVIPNAVLVLPAAAIAGVLLSRRRAGTAMIIAAGAALFAAGVCWWILGVRAQPAYLPHLLAGLLLTGIGIGFTMPVLFGAATAPLPPDRFATGAGMANMTRQVGIALGVAVLVAVLGGSAATSGHVGIHSLHRAWIVITLITVTVPLPVLIRTRGQRRPGRKEPEWQTPAPAQAQTQT